MHGNKGYMMILAAGALWGTIGLFSTLLNNLGMDPAAVAFYRLLSASLLLIPLLLLKGPGLRLFRISKRGLLSCALIGFISQALYNLCYMQAIRLGGMGTAAVLLYTSPVFVAVLSRIFFKEPLGRRKLLAIAVNILGCLLTVTGSDFSGLSLAGSGVVMGVLAGLTYGTMPVFSRIGADEEDPFTSSFYGLALGALCLFFLVRPYRAELAAPFSPQIILVLLGFGLIPSLVAYVIYFRGLNRCKETSLVPVLASVETVAAALIGLAVFGQPLDASKIAGMILVLLSIVLMSAGPQKTVEAKPQKGECA